MTDRDDASRARGEAPVINAPGVMPSRRRQGLAALIAVALGAPLVSIGASLTPAATVAATATEPAEVLHYRLRSSMPAWDGNPAREMGVTEVWQAGDGSRVRSLVESGSTMAGHERTLTRSESRSYHPGENRIVFHRGSTWLPRPAGHGIPPQVGDPRTLPRRAQDEHSGVKALGEATVNDVPVLRYRLGSCRAERTSQPNVFAITRVSVVSIHRDSHVPVRVEQPPCRRDDGGPTASWPGESFDYLQFETLPATEANLRQLEMSSHPGAVEVDGAALDAAEESSDPPRARPVRTGSGRAARSGRSRGKRHERSRARRGRRAAR